MNGDSTQSTKSSSNSGGVRRPEPSRKPSEPAAPANTTIRDARPLRLMLWIHKGRFNNRRQVTNLPYFALTPQRLQDGALQFVAIEQVVRIERNNPLPGGVCDVHAACLYTSHVEPP